jgi:hypothetical protein
MIEEDFTKAGSITRRCRPLWMAPFLAARYAVKRRRLRAFHRYLHGWWLVHEYDRQHRAVEGAR